MNKSILIIEDEFKIRRVIKDYLLKEGFRVFEAENGEQGLYIFNREQIDLIVLDIMMPKMNGWEVCEKIREVSKVLIIMLTAKTLEEDHLQGYGLGADDYIEKPFNTKVLIAKIKTLLSRFNSEEKVESSNKFAYADLIVDKINQKVYINDEEILLTPKEFNLLIFFIDNPNISLSRNQILDEVWGIDYEGGDRSIDACVRRLRKKLKDENLPLKAVWGWGYRFEVNE